MVQLIQGKKEHGVPVLADPAPAGHSDRAQAPGGGHRPQGGHVQWKTAIGALTALNSATRLTQRGIPACAGCSPCLPGCEMAVRPPDVSHRGDLSITPSPATLHTFMSSFCFRSCYKRPSSVYAFGPCPAPVGLEEDQLGVWGWC